MERPLSRIELIKRVFEYSERPSPYVNFLNLCKLVSASNRTNMNPVHIWK